MTEIATMEALFDFILADKGQTSALYFIASEEDLQYGLKQPWTSIGLDAGELPLEDDLAEPGAVSERPSEAISETGHAASVFVVTPLCVVHRPPADRPKR